MGQNGGDSGVGGGDASSISDALPAFLCDPSHVVYADTEGVLTWLWNYRDGMRCCLPCPNGKEDVEIDIVLVADTALRTSASAVNKGATAIQQAASLIPSIGGIVTGTWHLDASIQEQEIELPR